MDIETKIAERLVDDILAAGYTITVNDGQEDTVIRSNHKPDIMAALRTTCWDYMKIMKDADRIGWFWLVWGNGVDLVSDYSWRASDGEQVMADLLEGAQNIADATC
jgi:hypothetical protein